MAGKTFTVRLANGRGDWTQVEGLTSDQAKELNNIGEAGKTSDGRWTDREEYLNATSPDQTFAIRTKPGQMPSSIGVAVALAKKERENAGREELMVTLFPGKTNAQKYVIHTGMGRSRDWRKLGLTPEQCSELDSIGYSGKNSSGERTTFEEYLNGLGNGFSYKVEQTSSDSGDFCETYDVVAVRDVEK